MDEETIKTGSLVLYKKRPARVVQPGSRLEIELESGSQVRVRSKDVLLLHPGPLSSLNELQPQDGEGELAWEILREDPGEPHTLAELAELIYGKFTPSTAWAAWQWVDSGLYFYGTPQGLNAHSQEEVAKEQSIREARAVQAFAWSDFINRARSGRIDPTTDAHYLKEVEDLALGRRKESRLLRELGRAERPEVAHALLLECGYWDFQVDPYPARMGVPTSLPQFALPSLPDEPRLDLTHLSAYAIDDRENQDPDDALSLDSFDFDSQGRFSGGRIWVHIADAAALILPGSPADLEARSRGATLYLPEGPVPMLPPGAVEALGLGLVEISPALSFGLEIGAEGEILDIQIQPSWVRVQRLSYEQVEENLDEYPFKELYQLTQAYQAHRQSNGALLIDLPEVMMHVTDGQVSIRPLLRLRSRNLVREAMLMAGEAAARFAIQHNLPFPFATQEKTDPASLPNEKTFPGSGTENLALFFAIRKKLKRGQVSGQPAWHSGLGLTAYSRATSPLRRYLDLVVHQQLRLYLRQAAIMNTGEILERVGAAESVTWSVTQTETLARRHWTLVSLLQNPGWQSEGILVEKDGLRAKVLIPELALESNVHLREDLILNSRIKLALNGINLPELEVSFSHISSL